MDVREHPNQPGYIIKFPNGIEYATQEGDRYYPEAYKAATGEEYIPVTSDVTEEEAPDA